MTLIEFVFDRYKRKDVSKKTINWNCIAFGMAMKKDWGNKSVCNIPLIKTRIDFSVHVKSLHTFSYNLVTVKSHSGFVFFHSTLSIFCFMHPCQQLLVSPWQLKTIHTHVCSQIAWCGPNKKKNKEGVLHFAHDFVSTLVTVQVVGLTLSSSPSITAKSTIIHLSVNFGIWFRG